MKKSQKMHNQSIPKRVLITGATSGIGESVCHAYQRLGWQVIACGRNEEKLAKLELSINITTIKIELGDALKVKQAFADLDSLDLVILNAGSCEYIEDAKNFDGALFERVIHNNLIAVGYCLEALLPKISSGGQLALVGSSASFLPFSRAQAYGASKSGIEYLASSLAIDLKASNVDVSLIRPGFVKTPLTDKNNFNMPMQISSEQAAEQIVNGLNKRQFDIHFPKKFTWILRMISYFPFSIWRAFSIRALKI